MTCTVLLKWLPFEHAAPLARIIRTEKKRLFSILVSRKIPRQKFQGSKIHEKAYRIITTAFS
jgi:hypothetical protein